MKIISRFRLVPVLFAFVLFLTGCEDDGGRSVAPDAVFLAVGNGITSGSYPTVGAPWPQRLSQLLGRTVINEGVAGSHAYTGAATIPAKLEANDPDYLLILYGTNDLLTREVNAILEDLRTIVRAGRQHGAAVVIGTLPPMFEASAETQANLTSLNTLIRSMAASEGAWVADLFAAFNNDQTLMLDDGYHPTPAGQALIASTFSSVVQ